MERSWTPVAVLALAACMGVSTIPLESEPAPPVEARLLTEYGQAFNALMSAMAAEGYVVESADRGSGIVRSAWVPGAIVMVSGLGEGSSR